MAIWKTYVSRKTGKKYAINTEEVYDELLDNFSELEAFDRTHGTFLRFCGLWEQDLDPADCIEVRSMADLDYADDYSADPTLYDMGTYNDIHIDAIVDVRKQSIMLILEKFGERRIREIRETCPEYFYENVIAVEDRFHPIREGWTYDGTHLVSWEDATPIREVE